MRDPPSDLPDATLRACIGADYGLDVAELTFLPLGHDAWAWVYRVRTLDGGDYFLKVRRQLANLPGLLVPRHLRDRGSTQVVAPIPTAAGALWAEAGGYALVLYPFVAGETGMAQGLTAEQWIAYGALLRQVHETAPGPDLLPVMRREDFAPASAELIPRLDAHIGDRDFADPGERAVARFWQTRRALIRALLERARELGRRLARSAPPLVLCHADSHTANVLVDADGRVWFVDWDETILAPRERDLMFVVGGISRRLVGPREEASPAAAPAAASEPRRGGRLQLAILQEPDQLDPQKTIQAVASSLNTSIYDRLVYIGEDRAPKPWLAESWEISPDQKTVTFKIRRGVKFHDGTDLDARAVAWSFNRILDPKTASPAKAQLGTLEAVSAPDDTTVVFQFSSPFAPFFTNISTSYGGIVSPKAVEEKGDTFGKSPVGSGPFMFKEWRPGAEIILQRNPNYTNYRADDANKGAAYLDEIQYKVVADPASRTAALETGEIHIGGVTPEDAPRFEADPNYQIIIWKEATNMEFVEFANKEPFTDPLFRKGIGYAIDRDTIVKAAYNGYATPNQNPIPVGVAGYDPALGKSAGPSYDPEKAKQFFAEAGWKPNAQGLLEKNGQPARFTLLTYTGSSPIKKAAELIQANLNAVGMDIQVQLIEFGAMQTLLKKGEFDFDVMRWTWSDPVILSLLFKTPGWVNQTSDPKLDELLARADAQLDPARRLEAVKEAQKYILDQMLIVPISTDWIITAARQEVKGYKWDALGGERLINVWLEK